MLLAEYKLTLRIIKIVRIFWYNFMIVINDSKIRNSIKLISSNDNCWVDWQYYVFARWIFNNFPHFIAFINLINSANYFVI